MPITQEDRLHRVEIRDDGLMYKFVDEVILVDGVEHSQVRRGSVVEHDADLAAEDDIVKDVAGGFYTQARKDVIDSKRAEQAAKDNPGQGV